MPVRETPWTPLQGLLVTLAVCLSILTVTSPFIVHRGEIYLQAFVDASIYVPWVYDYVGRRVTAGESLTFIHTFGFPRPIPLSDEVFAPWDAILNAPATLLPSWTDHWSIAQAGSIAINGLAMAALARTTGAGALGTILAGLLGALCPQVLKSLAGARGNDWYYGLTVGALAAILSAVRLPAKDLTSIKVPSSRPRWLRGALLLLATILGWWAAMIYPPTIILWMPACLVLLRPHLKGCRQIARFAVPVMLAFLGAVPFLSDAWAFRGEVVPLAMKSAGCLDDNSVLTVTDILAMGPGRLACRIPISVWPLALFALADPKKRRDAAILIVLSVCLLVASLGPCPRLAAGKGALDLTHLLVPLGMIGSLLTDMGRLGAIAWLQLVLVASWGVGSLVRWLRDWRKSVVAIGVMVGVTIWTLFPVLLNDRLWQSIPPNGTVQFLSTAAPGVAAVLPYTPDQHLVALALPEQILVNPFPFTLRRTTGDAFVDWLNDIGRGIIPSRTPTSEEIQISGVRWIIFVVDGCPQGMVDPKACSQEVLDALQGALGPPSQSIAGLLVWDLS